MIGVEDAPHTDMMSTLKYYRPFTIGRKTLSALKTEKSSRNFNYSSDNNRDWMSANDLSMWIKEYK